MSTCPMSPTPSRPGVLPRSRRPRTGPSGRGPFAIVGRRDAEPDQHIALEVGHGQRTDLPPAHTVVRDKCRHDAGRAVEADPRWGLASPLVDHIDTRGIGLEAALKVRPQVRDHDGRIRRSGLDGRPNHQRGLVPGIVGRQGRDARHDAAISCPRSVGKVKAVSRLPDVAAAGDRKRAARCRRRAEAGRAADIDRRPGLGKLSSGARTWALDCERPQLGNGDVSRRATWRADDADCIACGRARTKDGRCRSRARRRRGRPVKRSGPPRHASRRRYGPERVARPRTSRRPRGAAPPATGCGKTASRFRTRIRPTRGRGPERRCTSRLAGADRWIPERASRRREITSGLKEPRPAMDEMEATIPPCAVTSSSPGSPSRRARPRPSRSGRSRPAPRRGCGSRPAPSGGRALGL